MFGVVYARNGRLEPRGGEAFAAPFAHDCDFVAFDGVRFRGREELARFHDPLFKEVRMKAIVAKWSLLLLCASMGAAIGGGLYEHIVLTPIWSASPPSSFTIIQPDTGVPLQRFWIPVHIGITVSLLLGLIATWRERKVRRMLLVGLASYVVMRIWSGAFFIPEMLAFQQIPPDSVASEALRARVGRWTSLTVWRELLDVISFLSFMLAFFWLNRPPHEVVRR